MVKKYIFMLSCFLLGTLMYAGDFVHGSGCRLVVRSEPKKIEDFSSSAEYAYFSNKQELYCDVVDRYGNLVYHVDASCVSITKRRSKWEWEFSVPGLDPVVVSAGALFSK